MCFLACKFSRKQLLNFRNACVSHNFKNPSLTIIWNNLDLTNYKRMKTDLEISSTEKNHNCYNSKKNYLISYSKERPLAPMHLWHLSTIPSFWEEYFAERSSKGVS